MCMCMCVFDLCMYLIAFEVIAVIIKQNFQQHFSPLLFYVWMAAIIPNEYGLNKRDLSHEMLCLHNNETDESMCLLTPIITGTEMSVSKLGQHLIF